MNSFGFMTRNEKLKEDVYTVKNGDSLYSIAKKYNVSIEALINANDLTSTQIYPNQVIVIPVKVSNIGMYFEEYVIKPSDTLQIISESLNIPVELIIRYNDVSKLVLGENQTVQIPKYYRTYVIENEDTLDKILNKTNMTLEDLVKANYNKWFKVGEEINII